MTQRVIFLLAISSVILANAVGLAGCGGPPRGAESASGTAESELGRPTSSARAISTAELRRESLVTVIEGAGTIFGIREVSVVAETEGRAAGVLFELGDTILENQPLVEFGRDRERSELAEAEAQLELARIELAATESLKTRGSASEADVARRRGTVAGIEARVSDTRKRYEDRTVRSPVAGRVAQKPLELEPGAFVARGTEIARIIDTQRLRTEIGIGEREIRYVVPGATAQVQVPACSPTWRDALVTAVGAGSDRRTGSFPVRVEWDNPCLVRVRAGMSVRVRIVPQGAEEHLIAPSHAVIRRAGSNYVFVVENGHVQLREVDVDQRFADRVALSGAVAPGDLVAVSALSVLRDGDRVEIESSPSTSG